MSESRHRLAVTLVLLGGAASGACRDGAARVDPADAAAAVAGITEADVLARIGLLAADSMRGRATPSPELEQVAVWIAAEMRRFGLEPAFDTSYIQRYPLGPAGDATLPTAPNVAALLPGSDPTLRDEVVLFSAHMDHVGVGAPDASGDSIWNGADDDASGTAAVLELAEAFATLDPAPRRSLVFLLVSGEERGLLGSAAFVADPPVPVETMVAGLNVDMVGRNWTDTIVAIGREHSDLGRTLDAVGAAHPELGMTAIDDLWPEESFYTRSDHFNFARAGVPVLFFFNGVHEDYHRPSDEVERIDGEKAARITRLLFWLGLEIADRDEAPRWNAASRSRIVRPR